MFVSSGFAQKPHPGLGSYCISKAGLRMAWKILNEENNSSDVQFGYFLPGKIDTQMQKELRELPETEINKLFKQFKEQNKLKSPETVSKALYHIMSTTTDKDFCQTEWNIENMNV